MGRIARIDYKSDAIFGPHTTVKSLKTVNLTSESETTKVFKTSRYSAEEQI
jgi:hypothetical protein